MKLLVVCLLFVGGFSLPVQKTDPELSSGNFEGDMELNGQQIDAILNPNNRNGLVSKTYRWPDNIVYYEIDSVFDEEHANQILNGIQLIKSVSCLEFRPRTADTKDYIFVTGANSGCHSSVGRRGGKQTLNLQIYPIHTGCFRIGTVVHEFLHALGFYHQQSASNRDDFVTIVPENIETSALGNFLKYYPAVITDFGLQYDYGSVMHYSATAFSKNGLKTIVTKDPTAIIGQRLQMSEIDIKKLNAMYECNV